jgi:hypothetical protein
MTRDELKCLGKKGILFSFFTKKSCIVKYEKGAYIAGIKVFNHLPQSIKILVDNEKSFKVH